MSDRVYLVMGDTRDYSRGDLWTVAAYWDRGHADGHVQRLTEAVKLFPKYDYDYRMPEEEQTAIYFTYRAAVEGWRSEYGHLDPEAVQRQHNTDKPTYEVREMTLYRHLDEFLEAPPKTLEVTHG